MTISFSYGLLARISLTKPNKISVFRVLSWASSRITIEYFYSLGSTVASLKSIPSVIYFKIVFLDVRSSKRIEYPTYYPNSTSISSLTLFATDIAATLRGCVQAIDFPFPTRPLSIRNWGTWVVLPEPVYPTSTITWCSSSKESSLCLESWAGSFLLTSNIS